MYDMSILLDAFVYNNYTLRHDMYDMCRTAYNTSADTLVPSMFGFASGSIWSYLPPT